MFCKVKLLFLWRESVGIGDSNIKLLFRRLKYIWLVLMFTAAHCLASVLVLLTTWKKWSILPSFMTWVMCVVDMSECVCVRRALCLLCQSFKSVVCFPAAGCYQPRLRSVIICSCRNRPTYQKGHVFLWCGPSGCYQGRRVDPQSPARAPFR